MLGIQRDSFAFDYYIYSLQILDNNPESLHCMIKEIYYPLSRCFGHDMSQIERTMRETVARIYSIKKDILSTLVGTELTECPTVSEFLEILAGYMS